MISQKSAALDFDHLIELLESTFIQEQRRSQFEHREGSEEEESALIGHDSRTQGFKRKRNEKMSDAIVVTKLDNTCVTAEYIKKSWIMAGDTCYPVEAFVIFMI